MAVAEAAGRRQCHWVQNSVPKSIGAKCEAPRRFARSHRARPGWELVPRAV